MTFISAPRTVTLAFKLISVARYAVQGDTTEMSSEEDISFDCNICLVRLTYDHTRTFDHIVETLCRIKFDRI